MESLRLDGTTIRGLVKGRPVNCIVRSVPDGLVLPPGQYVLRVGENNPIYGLFLSVEAAGAPGAAASALKSDARHGSGGIETLARRGCHPGADDETSLQRDPRRRYRVQVCELQGRCLEQSRRTSDARFDAPAIKYVPGQGMVARVIIAIRPIGQNCLVAQAGFSDLADVVQQAGGVGLIVA